LLNAWFQTIQEFPGAPDDHCLDRAFNIRRPMGRDWRWAWLDKAYARYLWWIYVRPVIDHPQFPEKGDPAAAKIMGTADNSLRWNKERAELRTEGRLFPRDAIIDAEQRLILRPRNIGGTHGRIEFAPYAPLHVELFLARESG